MILRNSGSTVRSGFANAALLLCYGQSSGFPVGSWFSFRLMPTIRVAHFHSSTGVYGAERWTATLIRYLTPAQIDSVVVTIGKREGSDLFHRFVSSLGHGAVHLAIGGRLNFPSVLALRRLLIARNIDILHTHGFKSDVLGYLATRRLPIRLVATPHGWSADEGLRIRIYEAISRLFLRRFDRVYPLSPALLQDLRLRGFPAERTRLVLNAVDTGAFEACRLGRTTRPAVSPLRILFVGRLCRPKGVFELLDAFHRAALPEGSLLRFAGDGPERQELEASVAGRPRAPAVEFVGAVPLITPHLEWCDVLVLPSRSEGIPRVIMEAFAAGVPVIGTDIAGVRQLVEQGVTGTLVPVADAPALAAALERLAADPEGARRMSVAAHALILDRYSARRQASEFEREYAELVGARPDTGPQPSAMAARGAPGI
jgi:glycosyltransferase involved in cell wall biosynthesis